MPGMPLLDIRQRTGYLFVALTIGHVILISAQVTTQRGVPLLETATFGVVAEVQRGVAALAGGLSGAWDGYVALQDTRAENVALREEVAQLQVELQEERAVAGQSRQLQELLDLQTRVSVTTTGASVIAGGASPDFRTITIDKGAGAAIGQDMAVISPSGVVGRVVTAAPRASKVQLLIDRNAAAGVIIERSRAQGVVVGSGGDLLAMEYVAGSADLREGDLVVTSGIDGIYPKGFLIGRIESVTRNGQDYGSIVVRPSVDFSSLESVLVVLTRPVVPGDDSE